MTSVGMVLELEVKGQVDYSEGRGSRQGLQEAGLALNCSRWRARKFRVARRKRHLTGRVEGGLHTRIIRAPASRTGGRRGANDPRNA